ncbi:hypothetical protein D3C71_1963590 [compost metagenome]
MLDEDPFTLFHIIDVGTNLVDLGPTRANASVGTVVIGDDDAALCELITLFHVVDQDVILQRAYVTI